MEPDAHSLNQAPLPARGTVAAHQSHEGLSRNEHIQEVSESSVVGRARRGHSDGDLLGSTSMLQRDGLSGSGRRTNPMNRPTNHRPLQPNLDSNGRGSIASAQDSAELTATDRMRRLSRPQDLYPRRRTVSSVPYGGETTERRVGRRPRAHLTSLSDERLLAHLPTFTSPAHPYGDLNRPLPRTPNDHQPQHRRSRELMLPRWQPDSQVTNCPICHTTFNFWYRKHHCRKCGRVVCANCSPHRITIPRQFIVHPPGEVLPQAGHSDNRAMSIDDRPPAEPQASVDRQNSIDFDIDAALGGGQEVRLCNPCVPDPNPTPYPSSFSTSLPLEMPSSERNHGSRVEEPSLNEQNDYSNQLSPLYHRNASGRHHHRVSHRPEHFVLGRPAPPSSEHQTRSPFTRPYGNAFTPSGANSSSSPGILPVFGSAPDQSHEGHAEGLRHRHGFSVHPRHRAHVSMGTLPSHPRYSWARDTSTVPPQLQPQLREEDECPVCHGALPPKGPDASETERESHINACIDAHFLGSPSRTDHGVPSPTADGTLRTENASPSHVQAHGTQGPRVLPEGMSTPLALARRRTTGMVIYSATEKDCVGEGGEGAAECVICFEEFAVGDEMGRLECLCKYHKLCIRQWWNTKGPGACPVHQRPEEG